MERSGSRTTSPRQRSTYIIIHFLHAQKTNQTRLPDGQEMRLVAGIFALQNPSKTSRPVVRTTGLIPIAIGTEAFVHYSDSKENSVFDIFPIAIKIGIRTFGVIFSLFLTIIAPERWWECFLDMFEHGYLPIINELQ